MASGLSQFAPRYRVIANQLRRKIRAGEYGSDLSLPSEAVLTKKFNVSRGTIREAVALLAQEKLVYGVRGKGIYVAIPRQRVPQMTLVFSYCDAYSLHHPYLNSLYHSFEERLRELSQSNGDGQKISVQCIRVAKSSSGYTLLNAEDTLQEHIIDPHHVQGLCLTTSIPEHELVEIQRRGISCIYLDSAEESKCSSIYIDHFKTKMMAITHLKELGHRNIGLVMLREMMEDKSEDETAWPKVLARVIKSAQEMGINISERNIVLCDDWNRKLAYIAVKELLVRKDRPTALVCFDDFLALGARDAAKELGLSVPRDLSLVGLGDYFPDSGLTTIKVPLTKMAQTGAEVLVKLIQNINEKPFRICLDDCELVFRQSSGPAPVAISTK